MIGRNQGYASLTSSIDHAICTDHMEGTKVVQAHKVRESSPTKSVYWERLSRVSEYSFGSHDWKFGLFAGLCASTLVLIGNVVLLIVGAMTEAGFVNGIGTIAKGQSDHMIRLSSAYHVLINICSTILLTSSNYAMQLLCAPTRAEIDRAHRRGHWLEIGLMSFRNLRHIDPKRALIWILLVCSSAPLHLLYNSTVFHVIAGQDHNVTVSSVTRESSTEHGWNNLSNSEWPQLYATKYNAGFGDLILLVDKISVGLLFQPNWTYTFGVPVASSCDWIPVYWGPDNFPRDFSTNRSFSVNLAGEVAQPTPWLASERAVFDLQDLPALSAEYPASINASRDDPTTHSEFIIRLPYLRSSDSTQTDSTIRLPFSASINLTSAETLAHTFSLCPGTNWLQTPTSLPRHVLGARAKRLPYGSKVQAALPFLCVVIASNVAKIFALVLTLRNCSSEHIVTIGDAISTFLEKPDPGSKGQCVLMVPSVFENDLLEEAPAKGGVAWRSRRVPVVSLLGGTRLWSVVIIVLSISMAMYALTAATSSSQSLGLWGTASHEILTLTSTTFDARGALQTALLANAPQICLSLVYLSINRICTSMCFMQEWNAYATVRKGLRVTNPSADQRPTHFLQLPYRWALPLTITSGLLHWLLSQSLFLVRRESRKRDGSLYPESTCACGYSALSILVFTCVFLSFLLVVLALSIRHLVVRLPPARHRSTIISAACHPSSDDVGCHLREVQWGVVVEGGDAAIGHCSFSSKQVTSPLEDHLYA